MLLAEADSIGGIQVMMSLVILTFCFLFCNIFIVDIHYFLIIKNCYVSILKYSIMICILSITFFFQIESRHKDQRKRQGSPEAHTKTTDLQQAMEKGKPVLQKEWGNQTQSEHWVLILLQFKVDLKFKSKA